MIQYGVLQCIRSAQVPSVERPLNVTFSRDEIVFGEKHALDAAECDAFLNVFRASRSLAIKVPCDYDNRT
jgi:hypothetical protein